MRRTGKTRYDGTERRRMNESEVRPLDVGEVTPPALRRPTPVLEWHEAAREVPVFGPRFEELTAALPQKSVCNAHVS